MSGYPPGALAELRRSDAAEDIRAEWRGCVLREMAQIIEATREKAEHYERIAAGLGYDDEESTLGDARFAMETIQSEFRN